MTWYNLIDKKSGKLISNSSVPIEPGAGRIVVETYDRDGLWNPTTRQYDPRPAPDVMISMREYLNRFTQDEYLAIIAAKKSDPVLEASYERLSLLDEVKISGARTKAVLEGLESAGIIKSGRAAEILNA